MQAALLRVKLPRLAEYTAKRQRHAAEYNRALAGHQGVVVPTTHPDRTHIANQYTLRVRRGPHWQGAESPRDALRRFLEERGIASEIYYPVPLHAQECFRAFGPHPALPVAEALADEAVSLPVFPEMTSQEHGAVLAAIMDFLESPA
jgi:dTDP-4-amino-4,6-dideoxygalactose transaminase